MASTQPKEALEQIKEFLKAKDDTSRFVGLALLKSVLDNQAQLRDDVVQVTTLWDAISPRFLDRLLQARRSKKFSKDESRNMVDIAVAVLHTFAILLPSDARTDARFAGRLPALVDALLERSTDTTILILQTLLTIVNQLVGAQNFLKLEDVSALTEIAPEQPLVLDIFNSAWSIASTADVDVPAIKASVTTTLPLLVIAFSKTDAITLLAFIGDSFPKLPYGVIDDIYVPWLGTLLVFIRKLVTSRPTKEGRFASTTAAAALLQTFPGLGPPLMFEEGGTGSTTETLSKGSKPYSYLFINLLLIDIRSSFPSLLSKLNTVEYDEISKRLSAAFDTLSSFIGFLIRTLYNKYGKETSEALDMNLMPPNLLLRLRKDIAETLSLAIEYLRDRYDASIAGAAGLHPSARTGTSATSEGTRLTITWESKEHSITSDTLILASIRTLSIWVREDDNENLRIEIAGLMDLFVDLYKSSSQKSVSGLPDFRPPILAALEAILTTDAGVEAFLAQDGWAVLVKDVDIGLIQNTFNEIPDDTASLLENASRGVDIIRVLVAIVDHESTTEPREDWMNVFRAAASMPPCGTKCHPAIMELRVAVLQLAAALINLAPVGMQRRYAQSVKGILKVALHLQVEVAQIDGNVGRNLREELDDVLLTFYDLPSTIRK